MQAMLTFGFIDKFTKEFADETLLLNFSQNGLRTVNFCHIYHAFSLLWSNGDKIVS